jgi:hypothetical protein
MTELKELIEKFDSGIELTDEELEDFKWYSDNDVDGEQHRWTKDIESIVKYEDRIFSLTWQEGLTENCDDLFYDQPIEVKKIETTKTIRVYEYVPIK